MLETVLPVSASEEYRADTDGNAGRTRVRRHQDSPKHHPQQDKDHKAGPNLSRHLLLGLTIAGVASSLLTTIFGLFHVDVFLNAYELPLSSYSRGSFIFSMINTVNDLIAAWVVDHASATNIERSDMVGMSGCVFAVCFLTPFFRWKNLSLSTPRWQDTMHFVVSMSLYDTLYSFTAILMGSIVTDDHTMSDKERVQFMASGKMTNLVASFVVARIGLALFDTDNLKDFRLFLIVLAALAAALFGVGHRLMRGGSSIPSSFFRWRSLLRRNNNNNNNSNNNKRPNSRRQNNGQQHLNSSPREMNDSSSFDDHDFPNQKLQWKRVASELWAHKNFRSFVVMEMCLEAQVTFSSFFLKTFVDELLVEQGGYSRDTCDWFLSIARPLKQVAAIFAYIPIRRFGYPKLYTLLFVANFTLAMCMLIVATPQSSALILMFLTLYPALTGAVQAAGFHLGMSDMVLEMKRTHALEGRLYEPSLAGLFMGTNALFCKPAESVLPMIAAAVMERSPNRSDRSLFYLLVLPPLVCSAIQFSVFQQYTNTPTRTAHMRKELQSLEAS